MSEIDTQIGEIRTRLENRTRPGGQPAWTLEASARVIKLLDRLNLVRPAHHPEILRLLAPAARLIVEPLGSTYNKKGSPSKTRFRARVSNWWNGTAVECTWDYLHQAELQMVEFATARGLEVALEDALAQAQLLEPTDPLRVRLAEYAKAPPSAPPDEPTATATTRPPVVATRSAGERPADSHNEEPVTPTVTDTDALGEE